MIDKLQDIEERFYYLEEKLSDPEIVTDIKKYTKVNKEYKELKVLVDVFREYKNPGWKY
jgi:peptide chain release factor 1